MKRVMIMAFVVCCSVSLIADKNEGALSTVQKGVIEYNGKKLDIVDAIATIDKKTNKLEVFLVPFKLSPDDIKIIKSGDGWKLCFSKKSPDEKSWPSVCPYGRVQIDLSSKHISASSVKFCNFVFWGMKKKNHTANLNRNGREIRKSIQMLTLKKDQLIFKSKSSGTLFDEKYKWNISVTCPLVEIKK